MIAFLQYSTDDVIYTDFGITRTARGQDYTITGLFTTDRNGQREFVGSRSIIKSRALVIAQDFLDVDKYFFRITYQNDPTIFGLGERLYLFDFEGNHDQNKTFYYNLTINFTTALAGLPVIPPEPKQGGRLTRLAQYGAPGRAYLVHFEPNPPAFLFDSLENVSFNSVYKVLT